MTALSYDCPDSWGSLNMHLPPLQAFNFLKMLSPWHMWIWQYGFTYQIQEMYLEVMTNTQSLFSLEEKSYEGIWRSGNTAPRIL